VGRIDLNSDVGEGFGAWQLGDDEALLDIVTSANVACGFHGGDPRIMRRVCGWAAQRGVAVGAQVGYRDLAGFGRRRMDVAADELCADVLYQLGALAGIAAAEGATVRYLKPHGALYNRAADDPEQADAVAAAVAAYDVTLPVLGLPSSALGEAASRRGLRFVTEGFADRAYLPTGRLVPRDQPGAVLSDPVVIAARTVAMAAGSITASDGSVLELAVDSVCVHGDTPGAVAIAAATRTALTDAGITVAAFT
jgi:UPF0271 protein